jgi:CubicO group peptidase (beta-lactamase class C family)
MRRIALLFIALLLTTGTATAQLSTARDTVDSFVNAYMEEHRVPGIAVAILEEGRLVKARGYGLANVEHSVPVTAETIFESGSIGKQFTAAAVLLLVEDGRLSLDDPITRHLQEAPASWDAVTIRHLLTHTGGLAEWFDSARVDKRRDYTEEELIRIIEDQPLLFGPGTEWSYCNSCYMVLGVLVSRLTGAHWSEFLRERVFLPVGMETARLSARRSGAGFSRDIALCDRRGRWAAASLACRVSRVSRRVLSRPRL